jgi:pimeloyl-ACP methyl ester carboxylesterase
VSTHRQARTGPRVATVICLHSSASSARQWSSLAAALAREYSVITPDLIGYGAAKDWDGLRPLTLDDEACRIEPLLAAAGQAVHLVGHSYGAAVALQLALRNPGRIRSIALYEPTLFPLLDDDARMRAESIEIRNVRDAVRDALRGGRAEASAQLFVDYWSGLGAWRALPSNRQQAIVARMPKVNAEFDALFGSAPPATAVRQVDRPTLLMVGTVTRRPPQRVAERLGRLLPDVTRQDMSAAGHMGPLTHADSINGAIGTFLAARRARAPMAQAA